MSSIGLLRRRKIAKSEVTENLLFTWIQKFAFSTSLVVRWTILNDAVLDMILHAWLKRDNLNAKFFNLIYSSDDDDFFNVKVINNYIIINSYIISIYMIYINTTLS